MLNIGSGLYAPSEGEAFVDGERVEGPNAHVAFMLQKDLLLPWRTIAENVQFGVEIQGLPLAERQRRAKTLLETLNLGEFASHYPHQLSGGMRQRVALARTLAVDPIGAAARRAVLRGRRADPHRRCSANWRRRSSAPARPRC